MTRGEDPATRFVNPHRAVEADQRSLPEAESRMVSSEVDTTAMRSDTPELFTSVPGTLVGVLTTRTSEPGGSGRVHVV